MDPRPCLHQLGKALYQAAAAGHDDAVVGDVAHQLGRRTLQHAVNGLQDPLHRLLKRLQHFRGMNGDGLGQARHQAAALHINAGVLLLGIDAADLDLHLLGSALTHQHIVLAAHILHHSLVELVAGHLDGGRLHHTGQADNGNIAGAAADVHHHVAIRQGNVNAGADSRGHRLLNKIHPPGAGLDAGIHHGALLHLGDAGGHADDDAGLEEVAAAGNLAHKFLEHPLGHIVVGDDTLPQRTNGHDVAGGTSQHGLSIGAHLQELAVILVDSHHGRLIEHNALALYIHQNGGRSQIDTNIFSPCTHSFAPHHFVKIWQRRKKRRFSPKVVL